MRVLLAIGIAIYAVSFYEPSYKVYGACRANWIEKFKPVLEMSYDPSRNDMEYMKACMLAKGYRPHYSEECLGFDHFNTASCYKMRMPWD
ncbi:hypothetical protein [Bosea sp. (in: a-proteobacteria)]|uniref:hypothetical protein n=1 Tax=Bosea sp. (in: a-proteobacteria) TaxID=1871050 RepID=UPI00262AF81C|nr:hypothetical protein [Bosea sp. (in: a-proteobacteria)]MCO5092669.1 hypothetical protein [Bosea sp. (in: a-proteobacteria)]